MQRILLVDDNADSALIMADLLRGVGFDVEVTHHADHAMQLLEWFSPTVAVLDLGLPDITGFELAKRVRGQATTCRLIALTGYGQPDDRARALAAGFDAFLVKPVTLSLLLDAMKLDDRRS